VEWDELVEAVPRRYNVKESDKNCTTATEVNRIKPELNKKAFIKVPSGLEVFSD
jgi:hypothetical protein